MKERKRIKFGKDDQIKICCLINQVIPIEIIGMFSGFPKKRRSRPKSKWLGSVQKDLLEPNIRNWKQMVIERKKMRQVVD